MIAAARRGLKMRAESPPSRRGGTAIGLARARQFARGENVSMDTVRRTFSFLSRAKVYFKPGKNTPGTQAFYLWGGPAGLAWAKRILGKK